MSICTESNLSKEEKNKRCECVREKYRNLSKEEKKCHCARDRYKDPSKRLQLFVELQTIIFA